MHFLEKLQRIIVKRWGGGFNNDSNPVDRTSAAGPNERTNQMQK